MGIKALVIVESPTKARTITKFLGKDYVVRASMGHVRDLPNSAKEIPAQIKKEPWARLGVNIASDFEPIYIVPPGKKDNVKTLKEDLKGAALVYLATDEDREGESISWHLVETLKPKVPCRRMVFHEITKEAIEQALASPREIDENLVHAQETRRIVDRLYGYEVSPLLWKKMAPGLSAGRVQSVAVRLLVERERERIKFKEAEFWSLSAAFGKLPDGSERFEAELTHLGESRVATGRDFEPSTGRLSERGNVTALDKERASALVQSLKQYEPVVESVDEKPFTNRPAPPFVTSTLQQEANRKLRLSAKHTMSIAQQLYENGYITYMRTDSTTLSEQALNAARSLIKKEFGPEYLPNQPRLYQTKVRNAQEAHEAIRPAGDSFTPMEVVRKALGMEAFRVYELICKRTVASQMQDAKGTHISVSVRQGEGKFRASGKTIEFAGFLRAYVEGSDDPEAELADQEKLLPKVVSGEALKSLDLKASEHFTQAPPRYTEGSLIKELESRGIGRPSTWASIVELVLNRSYAFKKGTALVPTFVAMAVVGLLEKHFGNLLDYQFTARLEDDLDAISRGEARRVQYLKEFYHGNGHPGLRSLVEQGEKTIDPREVCGMALGQTANGTPIEVRIGRYGPFITDGTNRSSVPDALAPDELTIDLAEHILSQAAKEPEALGLHPESGEPIYLKNGRFGPYLQLGEGSDEEKPKMASLLKNMDPSSVTIEEALKLLALPKTVGKHSTTGEDVIVANGRFGPYVKSGSDTRSIPAEGYSVLDLTLEQAIEILALPKGRGRTAKPTALRELGKHPTTELPISVRSGRFGPYVTDGKINATIPKSTSPEEISLDEAVSLLEARAMRIAEMPQREKPKRKSAKSAAPAKKAAAKTAGKKKKAEQA